MTLHDAKLNFIVEIATNLFLECSINDVSMKDIAVAAGIGEATIYRYFSKKEAIVLQCVLKLQRDVNSKYFKLDEAKTGFGKLEMFYKSYLEVFKSTPEYFNFIKEFDAYMCNQNGANLEAYEKEIDSYKHVFLDAYKLGREDNSIKEINDIEVFYFSTTHALLELCKKLSTKKALLNQDKTSKKSAEINYLVEIILNSLKNL